MGLFDKFKKAMTEPIGEARKPETVPEEPRTVGLNVTTNLSEKSVKIDVPDGEEGTLVKGVYLWEDENEIRGMKGDDVIFVVNKRSKAFGELAKVVRKKSDYIVLKKCTGDYGPYYRLRVKTEVTREEAGLKD